MGYEPHFDPDVDQVSTMTCINDRVLQGRKSYALSLDEDAQAFQVDAGIYLVWLDGLDPFRTVLLTTQATAGSPVVEVPDSSGKVSAAFPGSLVERLRVVPTHRYIVARLVSGEGTLYLVPLVAL